ncbi:helix-turn-helix domain-containing protein [Salipiger thiooxidans]|uniref:helix-turn-helix domain-containing protein n=1 Tax=Salipiger thiooxidans TaxID=282683 RepID=UPI001CD6313E|nr:helix-turn-helix transcriptional regulator [Salipiger thiooxidans]MCA0846089.1 helix-turn-helix transcriptional regulator [Salipiger thiooxidans]
MTVPNLDVVGKRTSASLADGWSVTLASCYVASSLCHFGADQIDLLGGLLEAANKALIQARVPCCVAANRGRRDACSLLVFFQFAQDVVMLNHVSDSANWHITRQVPNDTLPEMPSGILSGAMASDFRNALMWHMEQHGTTIAELVSATGVSRDVLNKLKSRDNSSTTVENGLLIAAYYGKTLNEFIARQDATTTSRLSALFSLLEPGERQLLEAQILGVISLHSS